MPTWTSLICTSYILSKIDFVKPKFRHCMFEVGIYVQLFLKNKYKLDDGVKINCPVKFTDLAKRGYEFKSYHHRMVGGLSIHVKEVCWDLKK